jgi:uncharacterized protein YndB with AHSA1/START domain
MQFVQSPPGDDPIVVEGFFAASPARVFNAWTNPDIVMKWFGLEPNSLHSADIDLRPGGAWRFLHSRTAEQTMGFEGAYAEIEPDERLVFSWSHVITRADGAREATPESRIEVTFTPKGSGSMVRLVHSAVRTEDARRGIGGGWEASFGSLRDVLAE